MEWSFGGSSSKYVSNNMPTTCNKRFYIFCIQEEFKDTKGVIRIHKSKNDRQHNDQKKKDKQRSTKHTHKTKERATQTSLKTGDELRWSRCVSNSCSTDGTGMLL
jgi:hypothetical protein